jgi:polyol transport system permease protein
MSTAGPAVQRPGLAAGVVARGGPGTKRRLLWARRAPLLPALVFLVVTTQLPFLVTLVVSFMDWKALYPNSRSFAGFDNFIQVFENAALRSSVLTTVVLTATVVLVSLVLGLALALLLDRQFLGRGIVRTLLIAPFLLVPIAAALMWKHVLLQASYGLINGTLNAMWQLFGSSNAPQVAWVSSAPLVSIEVALIWQWTPFMMLILLAGLQSMPQDVIEAARVDGANDVQIFCSLTLPHLRRYLELSALLGSIYIVQNFDAVYTITSGGLGTANLPYTIYRTFFQAQDYGLASAMGVVVVLATVIIATFALRVMSSLFNEEN